MKKVLSVITLVAVLVVNMLCECCFAATKYGFNYDTSKCDVKWMSKFNVVVRTSADDTLGTMSGVVGVARRKGTNEYVLMTKEVMTPSQQKARLSKAANALEVYGLSEYVSVKTTLPSLDNYQPKNSPSEDTLSISAGFSADKAGSIGASYTVNHSDLVITSKCETPNGLFYIEYDYRPSLINPLASNSYVAYESDQYGVAEFEKKTGNRNTVGLYIQYDIRFGYATSKSRSPWSIVGGIISTQFSRTYNIYF